MADHTHIEWTDATWNPITGCSVVSPGCTNCYAMKLAGTRLRDHASRAGLTRDSRAGPVWNGQVRFNEEWIEDPLRWRKPRRIFVCAHGDLFHESVPDAWIDRVFDVIRMAKRHTFQVLTKRPERMREYLSRFRPSPKRDGYITRDGVGSNELLSGEVLFFPDCWPLPNVWLGVSVEDQARADERIPHLLATPAVVRWISAEPLLAPVSLRWEWVSRGQPLGGGPACNLREPWKVPEPEPALDWVVVGGESGPGARPMHPDWARKLRDQCGFAGVPFFFKQWGDWLPGHHYTDELRSRDSDLAQSRYPCAQWDGEHWDIGDILAEDQYDEDALWRVGKRAAGRLLDGAEHNEYPVPA